MKEIVPLLREAAVEITSLRRRNEILEAQVSVLNLIGRIAPQYNGGHAMMPDIKYALEEQAARFASGEETILTDAANVGRIVRPQDLPPTNIAAEEKSQIRPTPPQPRKEEKLVAAKATPGRKPHAESNPLTALVAKLAEPFGVPEIVKAAKCDQKKASNFCITRTASKHLERVGHGQYKRTAKFPKAETAVDGNKLLADIHREIDAGKPQDD